MEETDKRKKKIALVTYALNTGGVSTFIEDLSDIFENLGYRTDIFATEKKGDYFYTLERKGKCVHYIAFTLFKWIPFGRVFHSLLCGLLIRRGRYSNVFLVHSYAAHHSLPLYRKKTIVYSVIQNTEENVIKLGCLFYELLDGIICVSKNIYDNVTSRIDSKKCFLIENSVHIPTDEEFIRKRKPLDEEVRILYLGRLDNWQKGIFKIPEIIKTLVNLNCKIIMNVVGSGDDKNALLKRISESETKNHIFIHDAVPREKVKDLYAEHHIFLMPSNFEGLPFTLMEAMSWGCVPVASMLKGVTDYCIDNTLNGFLVPSNDIKGFADAIKEVIKSKEIWLAMSNASREKARRSFSLDNMKEKYNRLIDLQVPRVKKPAKLLFFFKIYSWKEVVPYQLIMVAKKTLRKFNARKSYKWA